MRLDTYYRQLFAKPSLRRWNTFLFNLAIRGLGLMNFEDARASGEEYLIRRVLPRLLPLEPVVFDVGAHVGRYSSMILEQFPGATVHAFEPHPRNQERFNVPAGAKCVLHEEALGESSRSLILYDRADQDGSSHASLYGDVITEIHRQRIAQWSVSVRTLDEVCAELEIQRIDLLKIDVEGHELAVLDGAERMLERESIPNVQFEFNEMNVVSRAFLRDFRRRLPDHRLYRLLPKGLLPLDDASILMTELFAYQNIVAISRRSTRFLGSYS